MKWERFWCNETNSDVHTSTYKLEEDAYKYSYRGTNLGMYTSKQERLGTGVAKD